MNNFKNMQFKIDRKEQCERLQRVLQSLGYDWQHDGYKGNVVFLNSERLFTSDKGTIYTELGSGLKHYKEQDTDLFIALHENKVDKMVTMCFRDSDEGKVAFKGLETAWDEPLVTESPWFDNDGTKPNVGGASVDIMFRDGEVSENNPVSAWDWNFHTGESLAEIIKWRFHKPENPWHVNDGTMPDLPDGTKIDVELGDGRLHTVWPVDMCSWTLGLGAGRIVKWRVQRPEDAKYYVQPKTEVKTTGMFDESSFHWPDDVMTDNIKEAPASIDAHYSFTYHLTQDDVDNGFIKVDPYFVSQQWQLGSKDSTGVIFHIMKNISRFGDKNTKEREIIAIYKSISRLAQLEGVELK